jgi:hypothetical protein
VLEQFHRHLRHRNIYATNSSKWADPRARLLSGAAWATAKPMALASLGLPEDPRAHLAERAATLHTAFTEALEALPDNAAARFDEAGRLHLAALPAEDDPPSLVELRRLTGRMLPEVDLPDVLLEVFAWTGADQAFTSVTGGQARLADLATTLAALLVVEACNIPRGPVVKAGVEALTRARLAHVHAHYLRLDTIRAANAALIEAQAGIALAQLWGGGLVASVDGMRFVVPVRTVHAAPNPRLRAWTGRAGRHLAEHDQRPGRRARREGRRGYPQGFAVRARRPLRPRRRNQTVYGRDRHRVLFCYLDTSRSVSTCGHSASLPDGRTGRSPCGCHASGGRTGRCRSSSSTRRVSRSRSSRGSCGSWRRGTARRTRLSPTPTTFGTCGGSSPPEI